MFSPEQLLQIRHIVAEETTETLHRQKNLRSLVFYGLPEGDPTTQVYSILSRCNISKEYICIRHRLGNPNLNHNRPLRVDLREGIPMPSLRDLARKLSDDTSLRAFHVRQLETPRQRKEGFEKRARRRNIENPEPQLCTPPAKPPVAPVLEFSAVSCVDYHNRPVTPIHSPDNSIVDMNDPEDSSCHLNGNHSEDTLPAYYKDGFLHPVLLEHTDDYYNYHYEHEALYDDEFHECTEAKELYEQDWEANKGNFEWTRHMKAERQRASDHYLKTSRDAEY